MTDTSVLAPANAVAPETISTFDSAAPLQPQADTSAPSAFANLGLALELQHAVRDLGYVQPTAVQLKTIPLALPGAAGTPSSAKFNDLMVSSQTGSGKTAAFLLPVLHTLLRQQAEQIEAERAEWDLRVAQAQERGEPAPKRAKRKDPTNPRHFKAAVPGALVLCPTRELAQQVANDAIDLVRHCRGLRIANVVGGMPYQLQIAKLQNANLVVATPGRLLDLQRSMQIKLDQVQFLVVDEADRMLDLGFADDLADINQLTIERKQTMMFSATFAPRIQQLAARVMREPQRVTIDNPQEKHANIKQVLFWADNAHHKRKLLDHWLRDASINQAIVFASTQIECDGLAGDLQQEGFNAVALHGALSQGLRNRRLMALRNGQVQILVATDVAARGIDVPTITHVINYGMPMKAEDYVHRIGRTGRAGRSGLAVTLVERRDIPMLRRIERFTTQRIPEAVIEGLEPKTKLAAERGGPRRDKPGFGPRRDDRGSRFGGRRDDFGQGDRFQDREAPRSFARGEGRPEQGGERGEFGRFGSDRPKRPFADQPFGKKPFGARGDRPQGDRPFGDRPFGDRGFQDRGERSFGGDRPQQDRPFGDRPFADRAPRGDRPAFGDKPFGQRPGNKFGGKPFGQRDGQREDRGQGERSFGGDKPFGGKTFGGKPSFGAKPGFNKGPKPGFGGGKRGGFARRED